MASIVLLLVVFYGISLNNRQDMYWGNEVIPGLNIHGRTLQQIGVIDDTEVGNLAIHQIVHSGGFTCLEPFYPLGKVGTFWNPVVVTKCPRQAKVFSEQFPSKYAVWIIHRPRLVASSLIGPFDDGFSIPSAGTPNANPYLSLTPDLLSMLWATGPSGANPIVLELLLLVGAVAWMIVRRRPGVHEVLALTILACGGVVAVIVTVIASPLDTQRVASAPAMIARLFVIFGAVVFVDRCIVGRRWKNPEVIGDPSP
jgi:hypothetical protein